MKMAINTSKAPAALGPYSQGIIAGSMVYLSGQIAIDPISGDMPEGIEAQTRLIFNNIKAILEEASLTFSNVIKTTVYMADLNDFQIMNGIYQEYFSKPYPARATVEVSKLPKGALLEIECIAQL